MLLHFTPAYSSAIWHQNGSFPLAGIMDISISSCCTKCKHPGHKCCRLRLVMSFEATVSTAVTQWIRKMKTWTSNSVREQPKRTEAFFPSSHVTCDVTDGEEYILEASTIMFTYKSQGSSCKRENSVDEMHVIHVTTHRHSCGKHHLRHSTEPEGALQLLMTENDKVHRWGCPSKLWGCEEYIHGCYG